MIPEKSRKSLSILAAGAVVVLAGCGDRSPTAGLASAPDSPFGSMVPVDEQINQYDTWVTYDATREQTTYVSLAEPVVNAATEQPTTEITLTQPTQVLHTEAGYDAYGTVRMNEYRQPPTVDPYAQPVDETVRIQTVGDQVTGYSADGEVTIAAQESDVDGAPLAELGSLAGAQVTQGVIMDRRDVETVVVYGLSPSRLPVLRDAGSTTRIEREGKGRIRIVTQLSSAPTVLSAHAAAPPAREETRITRRYLARGEHYVLDEVDVDTRSGDERGSMRTRQTMRVKNVRWHQNPRKDAERRVQRARA